MSLCYLLTGPIRAWGGCVQPLHGEIAVGNWTSENMVCLLLTCTWVWLLPPPASPSLSPFGLFLCLSPVTFVSLSLTRNEHSLLSAVHAKMSSVTSPKSGGWNREVLKFCIKLLTYTYLSYRMDLKQLSIPRFINSCHCTRVDRRTKLGQYDDKNPSFFFFCFKFFNIIPLCCMELFYYFPFKCAER